MGNIFMVLLACIGFCGLVTLLGFVYMLWTEDPNFILEEPEDWYK